MVQRLCGYYIHVAVLQVEMTCVWSDVKDENVMWIEDEDERIMWVYPHTSEILYLRLKQIYLGFQLPVRCHCREML